MRISTVNLIIFTISCINILPDQVNSLSCSCSVCGNHTDMCQTIESKESQCYSSVSREKLDDGTYADIRQSGCLSGAEGDLSFLQCRVKTSFHQRLVSIKCCKDRDFCNEDLPDPTTDDDPRWDEPLNPDETKSKMLAILFVSIVVIAAIIVFIKLAALLMMCHYKNTKDLKGSTQSVFKIDLECKFNQSQAGSSLSTQSYTVSDDSSHKPISESSPPMDEMSLDPGLLTSGRSKPLNKRTMASAVGFGRTDHVGNGRFGRVFRGEYHGEDVAVKAFKTVDQDSWRREDILLKSLNHENIVRFIASELSPAGENQSTEIWMFLEYCPFGSLCDYLDHNEILGPQQAVKILHSIINGLNYLHEDFAQTSRLYKPSIAHRDIKSKNILMRTPDSCCLADFGHALLKIDENRLDYGKYPHLQVGTIRYMAPEMLQPDRNLDYKHFSTFAHADLYQFGLILWEVCNRTALDILHPAGRHLLPYDSTVPQDPTIQDMVKIVCEDQYRPPRFDKWDKHPIMRSLANLMVECWRPNPKARMETLGVKKRLKELHNQIVPTQVHAYQTSLYNNLSLSPSYKTDRSRSSDITF